MAVGGPNPVSRTLTIDHTKVAADLVNFPIVLSGTHPELRSVGYGGHVYYQDGSDIGVYTDSALTNQCPTALERYAPSTGEIVLWISVPSLSSTVDTVLYLAYGGGAVLSPFGSVLSPNTVALYRFADANSLTTDSSGNGLDGVNVGGLVTSGTGKIGNGYSN